MEYIFEFFNAQLNTTWEAYKVALEAKGSPTDIEKYYHGTAIRVCNLFHKPKSIISTMKKSPIDFSG